MTAVAPRGPDGQLVRRAQLAGLLGRAGGPAPAVEAAGGNALKRFGTKDPQGLAKWATRAHPWTALYRQLVRHMPPARAKRVASAWFKEVFGIWPGERFGDNPTGPG